MSNRLAHETSPYLLQHKDNPVDWYAWGDDALLRAKTEDKPILLSVGYAACHWCHVMERESFEDPETARLMNENFVNVKVDREERPDIDAIYMEAVQIMTGQGGWPMTVFLTPEGVPFYGGTYFPSTERYGMPSFKALLNAIDDAWKGRRDEAEQQGAKLLEHIGAGLLSAPGDGVDATILEVAFEGIESLFDDLWGGFGRAPKFPQPTTLDLVLRMTKKGTEGAERIVRRSLDAMAAGGIFDQLGGGFHRYSVDREWIVPHFEKMLYDNALLLRTYARSAVESEIARHREVAEMTAAWLLSEMRDAEGGFWSSLDADSEGEEGRFYVWELAELRHVAGDDADLAAAHWGVSESGNFDGVSIPVYARPPEDIDAIARARRALLDRRAQRVRPGTDTKVITAWNGMAVAALAEAGALLGHDEWVAAAGEAMSFVLSTLRAGDRLMRSYRSVGVRVEGVVRHLGFSDDYAYTLEGCLALFEATGEARWLRDAVWTADQAIELFWDPEGGGFYTTGSDAEKLITRPKDHVDSPVASANSVLALELQRLALFTGRTHYEDHALQSLATVTSMARRAPTMFGHALSAIDFYTSGPREIVIVGDPSDPGTVELLDGIRRRYLPNKVLVPPTDPDATPLLEGKGMSDGRATAYVCTRGACKEPVTTVEELIGQLEVP